ncbi:MAG: HepT-like ribonuclease domain-containing protein, partial [Candidatus Micrarchaeaceae archaeon]
MDIFYIISSDLDLSIPYDDTDLIDNLYSNQIINKEIAFLMKNMKGFRNIVVHRDGKIDDRIAYTFIRENL